ncbi:AEC family transporter [Streptacidiphilus sp. 4-A2]|nr:AEC family transporter [Streptacidiphilus sp. 4-A2]
MEMLSVLAKLFPVGLAFGAGVGFARRGVISAEVSKAFSDFSFLFAIPCYLFGNIYTSDLHTLFVWRALSGYVLSAVASMAVVGLVAYLFGSRQPRGIALRIMAGIQVNTAYFAVPVFIMLFGTATPIFSVLLFQVCVLSSVIILIMELGAADPGARPLVRAGRAVWASLTTPMVLACLLGLALNLLAVKVPGTVLDGFSFVGASASPVALFALGLHLGGSGLRVRDTPPEELWLIAFKCVLFPLLTWAVCYTLFGVRGVWIEYLVLIAAMPTPQNLFIFAQRYEVGVDMSASLVAKSSVAALLLLPLWMQLVRQGG